MIIDTHTHLDHSRFKNDIDLVIKDAIKCGVKKFIIPGASAKDLLQAVKLSEKYSEVYFAVGCHPYDIDSFDESLLKNYINHKKCVAVGECGLDYYRLPQNEEEKRDTIKKQKDIFILQIKLAIRYKKPLIVHIRDASEPSKDILIAQKANIVGGVLHCFNASNILIDMAKHNFYFGIGGVVTFKNAKQLQEILPSIPYDRLLIETDAPYLTPEPNRGKRNEPKYCIDISKKIAKILNKTDQEIQNQSTINATRLFNVI
ncbi:MAG: hydrolase TatD [Campylobacteraceae bacterium 4484_166]|nr:MAG: hydrolase TatD [Campylobacteraceae bacterium 4484_166]